MKTRTNRIRAVAGWKTAALLALVAIMAATAFGGVLSTTRTAEAQTVLRDDDAPRGQGGFFWVELTNSHITGSFTDPATASGVAGVTVSDDYTIWSLQTTGAAKATFAFNGATSLLCRNAKFTPPGTPRAGFCDEEGNDHTVGVKVTVAADSGAGGIVVTGRKVGDAATTGVIYISSAKAGVSIGAYTLKPAKTSIPASGTGNSTTVTVTVLDPAGKPVDVGTSDATLTTSRGLFTDGCATNNSQVCNVDVDDTGSKAITLTAGGVPGVATLRIVRPADGALATTATVTFHGVAANITAEPDASVIQAGDKTFVVVTVTDASNNPVPEHKVTAANVTVAGPTTAAVKVTTKLNMPKEVGTADGKLDGAGELPHCASGTAATPAAITSPTNYQMGGADVSGGTNAMGHCVIEVTAPKTPTMAARGNHMVTVKLNATKSATATIRVSGAPNAIKTDAPESVDALSSTNVAVTVHDDADMPVGAVPIQIDQISGEGKVTTTPTMTKDGVATFTYVAGLDGEAVFRIAAGAAGAQVTEVVRLTVGEMKDDDMGDDMTGKTWNKTPTAAEPFLVWLGEDGADPSAGAVEGVAAIWQRTAAGWQGYFPEATDMGTGLTSLKHGEAYWVVVR